MPKVKRVKYCEHCNNKIEDPGPNSKYCDDACRKAAHNAGETRKEKLAQASMTPEQVAEAARKLATSPAFEDEVREVMREEVRRSIDQYARDKVLGFVDGMVGMLPTVLVQLNRDLHSESWPERKTAYAILTKYVMPLMQQDSKEAAGQNNLVIQIGSDAQEAFVEAVEDAEYAIMPDGVEAFEADWPTCSGCGRRSHPDNVVVSSANAATYCRSCLAKQEYAGEKMPVEGGLSGRGRHADLLG